MYLRMQSDPKLSRAQKAQISKRMPLQISQADRDNWERLPFEEKQQRRQSLNVETMFPPAQKARLLALMPLPPPLDWRVAARRELDVNTARAAQEQSALTAVRVEIGEPPTGLEWKMSQKGTTWPDPKRGEKWDQDPQAFQNGLPALYDTRFLVRVVGGLNSPETDARFSSFARPLRWSVSRAWVRPHDKAAWREFKPAESFRSMYDPSPYKRNPHFDPGLQVRFAKVATDELYEIGVIRFWRRPVAL
jgi:hypothetical protein